MSEFAKSHDTIWLSPECNVDERTWCSDDTGCCDDCGLPTVKYLKATPEREAAPDMLAALKAYIAECKDVDADPIWPELRKLRDDMRAAIAKATSTATTQGK